MTRFSYRERDYAFGERMLTLRSAIGLTQAGLAELLGVSRRAVSRWEAGESYPNLDSLTALLTLAVRTSAFPPGQEEEEIRDFWKAAHQKVWLNEAWLAALLTQLSASPVPVLAEETAGAKEGSPTTPVAPGSMPSSPPGPHPPSSVPVARSAPTASGPRVDWGEALDVSTFYGRRGELATLTQWIVRERCRVVSVLGLGGIGKSALATLAMRQVASHFQVVLFRSLRDAPACLALLENCLQILAPRPRDLGAATLERGLRRLLELLREQRVLLVIDNLESVLEAGDMRGHLRPGYEDYARLLQAVAETAHQSCLLLTSREKPAALRALEGSRSPVRALRLSALDVAACEQLLAEHELTGSPEERVRLVERYEGNPLALNIVAETIADLFGGDIRPFLAADTAIFGGIAQLLSQQWSRLSALEQTALYWLAILREPVTLQELQAGLVVPLAPGQMLEAVDGLHRRSLIERGQRPGSFTLQSVVLEYVSERLVSTASQEIEQGRLTLLFQHLLSQAQAKDYVRQTQERLLLAPVLASLRRVGHSQAEVEGRLRHLLDEVRELAGAVQGYGPTNLVALLRLLRGHLRGLDLSQLALRGTYLQGVQMQDATLAGSLLRESVFTQTFDAITAVAISSTARYWAAAGRRGEMRMWEGEQEVGQSLQWVWRAHADTVCTLAFSPDDRLLASGGIDDRLKLWDVESGALLWSGWHPGIESLGIAPNGSLLATGGNDATVRLWDLQRSTQVQTLPHPSAVLSVAWSPDERLLASGSLDGQIRLWQIGSSGPGTCVRTLAGHSNPVRQLAFAPDASLLASASWDGTVKLWEVSSGRCLETLVGHTQQVDCVAWSADGGTLASGGWDQTIWLWDAHSRSSRAVLHGHTTIVRGLAFTPDSRELLSGSEDGSLRLWDVQRGIALRVLQGYTACLYDLDWRPDGTQIASAGADSVVTIWQMKGLGEGMPPDLLGGHEWSVFGVGWRPDGSLLAGSGWEGAIRLWDPATGSCLEVISDRDHPETVFWGLAWSPEGKRLASATYGRGVLLWDVGAGTGRWIGRELAIWFRRLVWSPDGTCLVAGAGDGHVYMWDASDGALLQRLAGHQGAVTSVAFSPDGSRLASGGGNQDGGELFVWDANSGERLDALEGVAGVVSALSWGPSGEQLLSGGSNGMLRWWDLRRGECVRAREAHQGTVQALKVSPDGSKLASCGDDGAITLWDLESGEHLRTLRRDRPYERLNITGIRGLSDAQKASLHALGAFEETSRDE